MSIKKRLLEGAVWLMITSPDLETEYKQCKEEGKDLCGLEEEFQELIKLDLTDQQNQERAERLLDCTRDLPLRSDYPFFEPSDLPTLLQSRPENRDNLITRLNEDMLVDRALGGWLGRCAGCALGKPVESMRAANIRKYLESQNAWPLTDYFSCQAEPSIIAETGMPVENVSLFREGMVAMQEDDDTNYTAAGLALVKQFGHDFTPDHVARFWLSNIPILHLCTAERVAYRNFVNCILPPDSAIYRNPYREWIGAQIRADFFGYSNPGNPEQAAKEAWRDGCISHVKNGIYGEMWVAAMLAAAYCASDILSVVLAGLSQIPEKCRLSDAIGSIIELWKSGASYQSAVDNINSRWNETNMHDWCHVISNAEIVAVSLLWGDQDFGKSICYSVMPGFDTDCNGATTGSVLGVFLGASNLPKKWTEPLNDTLYTGVSGYTKVSITEMARLSIEL